MMPPVSFPVRPGSGPAKPAEAANEFRTTATASIQRMGEGSCEMLDSAILSAIAMHISSAGADTFDDLGAAVVFPPYRLDRSRLKPTSALARDVTSWERGRPARSLFKDRREDAGGGRPRSQDERSRPYRPRDSCQSKNIPAPTTIAEPASSAADGTSPHTRNPIMIAH